MKKLLAHPVSTPLFVMFGLIISQFGYANLKRGSFQYTPEHGPAQIISSATNGTLYWAVTCGMLAVGALLMAVGAYACVCLFRACRLPKGANDRPPLGMFAFTFVIFVIMFGLVMSMCTRQ
jgi:hypothetical protein